MPDLVYRLRPDPLTNDEFRFVRFRTLTSDTGRSAARRWAHDKTVRAKLAAETEDHKRRGGSAALSLSGRFCVSKGAELPHSVSSRTRD